MARTGIRQLALVAGAALVLAGCEDGLKPKAAAGSDPAAAALGAEAISAVSLDAPAPADGATAAPPPAKPGDAAKPVGATAAVPAPKPEDASGVEAAATPAAKPAKERKGFFAFLQPKDKPAAGASDAAAPATPAAKRNSVRLVDRDVEAPDVYQVSDQGLWDGRPSLGGVWVASTEVKDPERVIIRNTETGAFVIGALFRRELDNPGPRLQVSSDAATALGMLAGAPAKLNVTALRREEVADPADAEALLGSDGGVVETPLDAAATPAAVAPIPPAQAKPAPAQPAAAAQPATKPAAPAPAPATSGKSYVQIGIFSVEANANSTADKLRKAGLTATVTKDTTQGKSFWRVIAGPAGTSADRAALLAKVKSQGFSDAYFVSR